MSDYVFEPAFPPGHFVSDYIAYASRQTDAAHEYHEAVALALLSTATPDVRAEIKQFPHALRTNLYLALIGSTSTSRKSTAKDLGVDILQRTFPLSLLPDKATPEAFAAKLAEQKRRASLWAIDEFAALLVQMHRREYLAGLVALGLSLYQQPNHTYERQKGNIVIQDAHLTIIGCAADTVFDKLHTADVDSGLLPRFAIVFPEDKPARLPFAASAADDLAARNALVQRLSAIAPARNDEGRWIGEPRIAVFTRDAFDAIDRFAQEHEERYNGEMFRRLIAMMMKVAILSAIGDFQMGDSLVITPDHVEPAVKVISRWSRFAETFTQRLGESAVENLIRRVTAFLKSRNKPFVARRAIARHLHVDSRTLAEVERTMLDRELIALGVAQDAKKTKIWQFLEHVEEGVAA